MRRFVLLAAMVLTACVALTATVDAGASGVRAQAKKQRLAPFSSCKRLIRYARGHAKLEARGGIVAPGDALPPAMPQPAAGDTGSAQPAAPEATGDAADSSGTNVQEAGVDEPDFVKSDGRRIFVLSGNRLNAIDARADTPKLLGSLELGQYGGTLVLEGDRLLVISYSYGVVDVPPQGPQSEPQPSGGDTQVAPGEPGPAMQYSPTTEIAEVDVSNAAHMKVVRTETVDGTFVDGRLNGATARLVLATRPAALDYGGAALRTHARGWLPSATIDNRLTGHKRRRLVGSCRRVRRPRVFSGLDTLTVLTIDMRKGLPEVDVDGLMTDAQTVYASTRGLYVATQRFVPASEGDEAPPPITTAIHRFDSSTAGRTSYDASGAVLGYVLSQFALSEHHGVLRVATTDSPGWWPGDPRAQPQSYVTTLDQAGGLLLPLGRVGGLGRGEQIRGVRFLGDAGYVVTFRQTDPLYTVDLSKPAQPRVAGELKLLGFSAYLHPVGDGRLLGIGQDASAQGRQTGTQVSLFDVSDLSKPERLAQRRLGSSSSSEAEYDHHAFLYWAPRKLAVLPVSIFGRDPFLGAIGFRIGAARIDEAGRIEHDAAGSDGAQIRRSLVVGGRLFTVSDFGAEASSLDGLEDEAWVPFPGVQPGAGGGGYTGPAAQR